MDKTKNEEKSSNQCTELCLADVEKDRDEMKKKTDNQMEREE